MPWLPADDSGQQVRVLVGHKTNLRLSPSCYDHTNRKRRHKKKVAGGLELMVPAMSGSRRFRLLASSSLRLA